MVTPGTRAPDALHQAHPGLVGGGDSAAPSAARSHGRSARPALRAPGVLRTRKRDTATSEPAGLSASGPDRPHRREHVPGGRQTVDPGAGARRGRPHGGRVVSSPAAPWYRLRERTVHSMAHAEAPYGPVSWPVGGTALVL